ncbi:hypothetical protein FKP32DRAFT_272792 [Trametes sanguinea]|nr:hypothetical protein FKP32DRAFT_272792 [Trametes sanguinea]
MDERSSLKEIREEPAFGIDASNSKRWVYATTWFASRRDSLFGETHPAQAQPLSRIAQHRSHVCFLLRACSALPSVFSISPIYLCLRGQMSSERVSTACRPRSRFYVNLLVIYGPRNTRTGSWNSVECSPRIELYLVDHTWNVNFAGKATAHPSASKINQQRIYR